jgi:hypothetical protein
LSTLHFQIKNMTVKKFIQQNKTYIVDI